MSGESASTSKAPSGPAPALVCIFLAVITFAIFGQTLRHGFINYDDNDYVYGNPMVLQGLKPAGIIWAFTSFFADNWHPLTWISHMVDCQLYGLHAGGHHLTNVLLHTTTVIALFLVLRQMTGAGWCSAFVAAVFAIHPLRVESVAWVAERKDVLSGLFFVLTIGAYARYVRRGRTPSGYGLVVVLFVLGLMSKPMLVTLPVILLLIDFWPLQRSEPLPKLILEKIPFFALSAVSCVVTMLAEHGAGRTVNYGFAPRVANAIVAAKTYLDQMLWPSHLAVLYPLQENGLPAQQVAVAGIVLGALTFFVWKERSKQPWLLTGWLWYLVMLLPVIGLVQVGVQAHADRYTYLPQIGIYVAITWLIAELKVNPVAVGALMAGIVAVLMAVAWQQTEYWQDSQTLWEHTLSCTKDNYVAHLNLGNILLAEGKSDQAISHFQDVLKIKPRFTEAHYDLGCAMDQKKNLSDAIVRYQEALQIDPAYAPAENNLGSDLCQLGRVEEGISHFQQALQFAPNYTEAHNNLGNALLMEGKIDDAIGQFKEALRINPNFASARYNLGRAVIQKK